MENRTRRSSIGNMLIDVAKYLITAIGIGGLVSEKVDWRMVLTGLSMALVTGIIGFWVLTPDDEEELKR